MLYFTSGKDTYISSKLWDNGQCNFTRNISDGIHQMEGHLEMAKIEIAFENFSLLRNFQPR
jgi:hypothetical protein